LIALGTSAATDATAAGVDADADELEELALVDEPPDGGVALAFALLLVLLLLPHPARAITPTSGIKIIQLRIEFLLTTLRSCAA
jgi:hypothetical protein